MFRVVEIHVIAHFQKYLLYDMNIYSYSMFMVYLRPKLYTSKCSFSHYRKLKDSFVTTIFLYYVLQKYYLKKAVHFCSVYKGYRTYSRSKSKWRYWPSDSRVACPSYCVYWLQQTSETYIVEIYKLVIKLKKGTHIHTPIAL